MTDWTPESRFLHPEAYKHIATNAVSRAFWLDQARFAVMYESIHGAPPDATPEQKAQRKALLDLVAGILAAASDREMDKACADWLNYQRLKANLK